MPTGLPAYLPGQAVRKLILLYFAICWSHKFITIHNLLWVWQSWIPFRVLCVDSLLTLKFRYPEKAQLPLFIWHWWPSMKMSEIKAIHFVNSVCTIFSLWKRILLNKSFQASQSWHQFMKTRSLCRTVYTMNGL